MTPLPRVSGLFEAHLTVADLDRSVAFYHDIIGLTLALEVPERGAAFFWIGSPGEAMLGLWSLGSAPMTLSLHIALKASLDDVLGACDALRSAGVTPLSFFDAETTEPSVLAWMPAAAVYLRDPDTGETNTVPGADQGIVRLEERRMPEERLEPPTRGL